MKVRFFGATADAAGLREVAIALPDPTPAGEILREISTRYPRLAGRDLLIAVNEEYADTEAILNDDDEMAVFTAVSGG